MRRLVIGLLVYFLASCALAGATTTASAATFTYDAPTIAHVDVREPNGAATSPIALKDAREEAASPHLEARGTPTTPCSLSVATEAGSVLDDAATAERHLARPGLDHSPANDAMLDRIRSAAADGRPLHESESNFLTHEVTEAGLMDGGMDWPEAHALAGQTHPTFANYHPDVIDQFPELFNSNWRNYWGMGPK